MAEIRWVIEGAPEDVARQDAHETEENARLAIACALYLASAGGVIHGTWCLLGLCTRFAKSVWHFYTVRRPIERAKKRE